MAQSMELVLNQREGGTELAESGGKESFDLPYTVICIAIAVKRIDGEDQDSKRLQSTI